MAFEDKKFMTRRMVCRQLALDGSVLDRLEELELIVPIRRPGRQRVYAHDDYERLRVYSVLVNELEVNGAGAEIILQMRARLMDAQQRMSRLLRHAHSRGLLDNLKEIFDALDE